MYQDVRGPDGRLLFRFDSDRLVVEIVIKSTRYVIDLTAYMANSASFVEIDPLLGVDTGHPFVVD